MTTPREPGAAGSDIFQITRVFNAPASLVFRAWTELESLKQWWGPKGFAMQSCTLDLKPGGKFHYCMLGPGGAEMWGKLVFREIVPPEKIVFVSSFSDKDGGYSRHPMAPGWPVEILSVVTFAEHHGKTTMTMRGEALNASESERAFFTSGFDSMRQGWGLSLDQLDAHLAAGTDTKSREIVVTRLFDAPRELVFRAWTSPEHLEKWWGPDGFTTTTKEFDMRAGGVWRHVMHGPDGVDYPNLNSFEEIVPPERIVYSHSSGVDENPAPFHVTVTFEDEGGKTRLTMRSIFPTAAVRDFVVKTYGAIEGATQMLGRLAGYLVKQ